MMRKLTFLTLLTGSLAFAFSAHAAPRPHVITFGQWMRVKLFIGPEETKVQDMNVRTLYVDGRVKEFVTGDPHDVTDKILVVRRVYRLNDALPDDGKGRPRPEWKWQRGGWMMVDRSTGRVSQLNLPDFDPFYSTAVWYRDYVAYCGLAGSADRIHAIVYQLGFKKPVVNENIAKAEIGNLPDSICAAPVWQKQPARVTFQPNGGNKLSFAIHGHASELQPAQPEGEEKESSQQQ